MVKEWGYLISVDVVKVVSKVGVKWSTTGYHLLCHKNENTPAEEVCVTPLEIHLVIEGAIPITEK